MQDFGIPLDRYFSAHDEFEKAFSFMEKGAWEIAIQGFEKFIRIKNTKKCLQYLLTYNLYSMASI